MSMKTVFPILHETVSDRMSVVCRKLREGAYVPEEIALNGEAVGLHVWTVGFDVEMQDRCRCGEYTLAEFQQLIICQKRPN
jgi:hypothetical protein